MTGQTHSTLKGVILAPEVDRKSAKLALRIKQVVNKSGGRIVKLEVIDAGNGIYWLYVNGGKREVIE